MQGDSGSFEGEQCALYLLSLCTAPCPLITIRHNKYLCSYCDCAGSKVLLPTNSDGAEVGPNDRALTLLSSRLIPSTSSPFQLKTYKKEMGALLHGKFRARRRRRRGGEPQWKLPSVYAVYPFLVGTMRVRLFHHTPLVFSVLPKLLSTNQSISRYPRALNVFIASYSFLSVSGPSSEVS